MKRKRNIFVGLSLITLFLFASCDLVKSGLSSELEVKLNSDIGEAYLNSSIWNYNGSNNSNISTSTTETIKISFTKRVKIDPDGIKGSFKVSYTDTTGSLTSKFVGFDGGFLDDSAKNYILDATPIIKLFNGSEIPTGTADLTIEITGFLNNEGSEIDRAIPTIKDKISIEPLFINNLEDANFLSSKSSTIGKSILIPLNSNIELSNDATVTVTGGSSEILSSSDLIISVEDKNLKIMINTDLQGQFIDTELTVSGISAPLTGSAFSTIIKLSVSPSLIKLDGILDNNWISDSAKFILEKDNDTINSGTEASGLYVTSDSDTLYIAIKIDDLSGFWDNDSIGLYIDKANKSSGYTDLNTFDLWKRPANSVRFINGQGDIVLNHIPKTSALILYVDGSTYEESWSNSPINMTASSYSWENPNGPTLIEYKFKLNSLGLESGDNINVFASLTNKWSDSEIFMSDILPGIAPENGKEVILDFDNAVSFTLN